MDRDRHEPDEDQPTIGQRLHAATGDRDAEAKALADRAGDEVSEADAKDAVQRAHGDSGAVDSPIGKDLASAEDAKAAHTKDAR
jgi:hypothetical protein